jgi:transcriptional regulator with XRE-family HTH domain
MASSDDIVLKELSSRIKHFRKQKGLTQAEVADRMGLEDGNYRKFENQGNPTYLTLVKFCKTINLSLNEFFSEY